jgi:hypothetical protein
MHAETKKLIRAAIVALGVVIMLVSFALTVLAALAYAVTASTGPSAGGSLDLLAVVPIGGIVICAVLVFLATRINTRAAS